MESDKVTLAPLILGTCTRPSWAVLFLLFTVVTILSLQLSTWSVLPVWTLSGSVGPEPSPPDQTTCSGFFHDVPRRKVVASIEDFGGVGDGKTSNTEAFRRAIRFMQRFRDRGGSQLNIPNGKWLTGSFNLTSDFTLFLQQGAVILASQDPEEWPIIEPLPSYGRGRERLGGRHISLIHGNGVRNVIITGQNGTVDGQGKMWWELWWNRTLEHTRGHLLELMYSDNVLVSNLTFRNSPFWTIHPVYCSNVVIKGMTILAPLNAPNTDGIDPDSSTNVCIEDNYIESGDDLVAIKSGWDHYGITMARPSTNIIVRRVSGTTPTCSGVGIGSEMSGGIANITIENLHVWDSAAGVRIKSDKGRGGYITNVSISDIRMERVKIPIRFSRGSNDHPDDGWDPKAVPRFKDILISNIICAEPVLNLVCSACSKPCRSKTESDLHTKRTGHTEFTDKTSETVKPISLEAPKVDAMAEDPIGATTDQTEEMIVPEVDKKLLEELESMGFSTARATRALHYSGNAGLESAVNWIVEHENDSDIDQMPLVPANTKVVASKPSLTPEELKAKQQELRERARKKKEEEEKRMEREREKERIRIGKELLEAKRIEEDNERKRLLALRKAEKEEERRAREKIKQKLEEDKAERRRKLGLPPEEPSAAKPSTVVEEKKSFLPVRPATKADQMRECLRSLKQNHKEDDARVKRAFQTLLTYVGNVARNPDEEKFRKIRLSNQTFQDRVGGLKGGIEFLEVCGFEKIDGGEFLFLPRDKVDIAVLNSAGSELDSAIKNPFFGVL